MNPVFCDKFIFVSLTLQIQCICFLSLTVCPIELEHVFFLYVGLYLSFANIHHWLCSTFTTVYSMRPLPTGAVFRCYPGKWKVFYDDPSRPNRYLLARELTSRPDATDIERIFGGADEQSEESPSLMNNVMGVFSSVSRFMRVISKWKWTSEVPDNPHDGLFLNLELCKKIISVHPFCFQSETPWVPLFLATSSMFWDFCAAIKCLQ